MKKAISLILAASMALGLAACGGEPAAPKAEELTLGTQYSVADYADFTLKKVSTTDEITAPMGNSIYFGNEPDDEIYVDTLFEFKNTGTAAVNTEDVMSATATNAEGANYFSDIHAIETDGGTSISTYEDINPMTSVRLHIGISVPKNETELTLKFNINGEEFTLPYTMGDVIRNAEELAVDDEIESADFAKMIFKGVEYTDQLMPPDTSGYYSYRKTESPDNTLLVAKFDITNLQDSAKDIEGFVGAKAMYMDKYTYDGYVAVEETDGTGFDTFDTIDPLTERHFYYIIEVPKSVAEEPVDLTIYFDGEEYLFTK